MYTPFDVLEPHRLAVGVFTDPAVVPQALQPALYLHCQLLYKRAIHTDADLRAFQGDTDLIVHGLW